VGSSETGNRFRARFCHRPGWNGHDGFERARASA
jgi:hypothetical protein